MSEKTEIKVLVITTFETGEDIGDVPGEFQYWVEREALFETIEVPGLKHPLRRNDRGLYAMVCGTTSRCVLQIMALAADPRFDLRKTYFLVAGVAGSDPLTAALATTSWSTHVVDGAMAFEIDEREIPGDWPYGLVAFGATAPGLGSQDVDDVPSPCVPEGSAGGVQTVCYKLNPSLVEWAYDLTQTLEIPDDEVMAAYRAQFAEFPEAQRAPRVMKGVSLACDRFWHGELKARWARDWVRLYTKGEGELVMSDCEDQGVCGSIKQLELMGKADFSRLLVLRGSCNFVMPPPGRSPADCLFGETIETAYLQSLDAVYRVGSVVVHALLEGWADYREHLPETAS
ncbi:purine-nucleoside phosphorylase [Coraliomargarita parva]|uniref:purine-nucleoside phosphorylase n=1 Tax=Coraliomargarita parva TaxID=3014050 RepID=UPI0022B45B4D|nr:purine nucleoside permease [Coraliomargarita parva]